MKRVLGLLLITLFCTSIVGSISPVLDSLNEPAEDIILTEIPELWDDQTDKSSLNKTAIIRSTREVMMNHFSENLGQIGNEEIMHYGQFSGGMIGFGASKIFIWLENSTKCITMTFLGSEDVQPIAKTFATYKSNYFLGDRGTFVGVRASSSIVYEDLYPGIDLEYHSTSEGVKYQFLVNPGAHYQNIRVQCEGYDYFSIHDKEVVFTNEGANFVDAGLLVYQDEESLEASFRLLSENVYGFDIPDYDETRLLVIDPLIHSTIISGYEDDVGLGITIDDNGFVYVVGYTKSVTFPTRFGLDNTLSGTQDAFVLKYELETSELIFNTYIGGVDVDTAYDVAVDGAGNIHLVGETSSIDFPHYLAADDTLNGSSDGFFLKLNPAGTTLVYSSYIGGTEADSCLSLHLNISGYVHLTGWTNSSDLTTVDPVQASLGGAKDMIVAIVNTTGSVVYSSYYGGSSDDIGRVIEIDSNRNILVAGTVQTGWPTSNALYAICNGGNDIGVLKLNSIGDEVLWATFIGGSNDDFAQGMAIDSNDDICIAGYSNSTDFPIVTALNASNNGGYDVVFLKIFSDGSNLNFSSYFGSTLDDFSYGLGIDRFDYLYIFGETFSSTFPVLNSYNDSISGAQDCFLFKLNRTGANLMFSTFFGGSDSEKPFAIALDSVGTTYLTGWTNSTNFPLTEFVTQTLWLDDWTFRKKHSIIGSSGVGTDYQIEITVYYGLGTDTGTNVYLSSNCKTDFSDIRFTDDDGFTLLSYWMEEYTDSVSATFWIKVADNLDTNQSIYIYYGQPTANTTSNGDSTFIFFDDFEGTSLNTSKWWVFSQGTNTYEVVNGELHADIQSTSAWSGYQFISYADFSETNYQVHVESRWAGFDYSRGRAHVSSPFLRDSDNQSTGLDVSAYGDYYVCLYTFTDGASTWSSVSNLASGNAVFDYQITGGTSFNMQMTGTYSRSYVGTIGGFNYPFSMTLYAELDYWTSNMYCDVYYDIVYIQKFVTSAPTHGSWELEEIYTGAHGEEDCFSIGFTNPDDADEDGLTDIDETFYGTNWLSNDTDSDLMVDSWEVYYGLDPNNASDAGDDPDLDGFTNLGEYFNNTNPRNNDTDWDAIPDYWEFINGLNPLFDDAYEDPDNDTIINLDEFHYGTSPISDDTDSDLMPDIWEINNSLNPLIDDSEADPDFDGAGNLLEYYYSTNPNNNDTDSDLMADGWEIQYSLNPLLDDSANDSDSDMLSNLEEFQAGTNPQEPDSDFDDLTDADEINIHGTNPMSNDTDSDLMPDGWEVFNSLNPLANDSALDPDLDNLTNLEEYIYGTLPDMLDSDEDFLSDYDEIFVYFSDPRDPMSPYADPEPVYSTYIGGTDLDNAYSIFMDSDGCIYVTGFTSSSNFPTFNAYDDTWNSNYDVFVVKFTSDGQSLVFSTFIGGVSSDKAYGICVDDNLDIYVCGTTYSSNFPIVNAYDSSMGTAPDAFLLKLASTGDSLYFSTYIGGSSFDQLNDLEVDENENIYATGITQSSNWPIVNAYDSSYGGSDDGVALKMSSNGSLLLYSTYIGGSNQDRLDDMTLDSQNRLVFTGWTSSSNFPVVNAYDSTFTGEIDAVVGRLSANGMTLEFSTYLGGSYDDRGHGVTTDRKGNIYLEGWTESSNFPTVNALYPSKNSAYDIFVTKLAENGTSIYFSTFIGGNGNDYGELQLIDLDQYNNIYVAARVSSTNLPTVYPYQDSNAGSYDGYFVKMSSDGQAIYFASYLGGSDEDRVNAMDVTEDGRVALTGWTYSSNFPIKDAFQPSFAGYMDTFVITFSNVSDYDGDGVCDIVEVSHGTNRFVSDTDSDLMPDGWEYFYGLNPLLDDTFLDTDSDLISNYQEYILGLEPNNNDTDSDALIDGLEQYTYGTDPLNPDSDSDLIPDGWEVLNNLDPNLDDAAEDLDADTLSNYLEYTLGWSANNNDTENDLMPDGWEYVYGLDGLTDDSGDDPDGDLLSNLLEYQNGCNPLVSDSDGDLLSDYEEVITYGTSPLLVDTDNDTLDDYVEIVIYSTSPFTNDTDSDLMTDAYEVFFGLDPLVNDASLDYDLDGLTNYEESIYGTTPTHADTDLDSLLDGEEVNTYGSNPFKRDTDSDGVPDFYEVTNGMNVTLADASGDVDSDGLINRIEYLLGTIANKTDSDDDDMDDMWEYVHGFNLLVDDSALDPDNDTLTNLEEYNLGTDPLSTDSDDDSLSDILEVTLYHTNPASNDTDLDLMPDGWEIGYAFDPLVNDSSADVDSDNLTNLEEFILGTNPRAADTDGDTISDGDEIMYGCDPLSPDSDGDFMPDNYEIQNGLNPIVADGNSDADSDNLSNLREYYLGTNPNDSDSDDDLVLDGDEYAIYNTSPLANDTDHDTLMDGYEIFTLGSNPLSTDSDGDHLSDADEVNLYGTDPTSIDSDADSLSDYLEVMVLGTSPVNIDTDNDSMTDAFEVNGGLNPLIDDSALDLDNDQLINVDEFLYGTRPDIADSDADTLSDGSEVHEYNSNPLLRDSDADIMPDDYEVHNGLNPSVDDRNGDVDGDGISNFNEFLLGTEPNNADTDGDTLSDYDELWVYGTNPLSADSDSDSLPDNLEIQMSSDPMDASSGVLTFIGVRILPIALLALVGLVGVVQIKQRFRRGELDHTLVSELRDEFYTIIDQMKALAYSDEEEIRKIEKTNQLHREAKSKLKEIMKIVKGYDSGMLTLNECSTYLDYTYSAITKHLRGSK